MIEMNKYQVIAMQQASLHDVVLNENHADKHIGSTQYCSMMTSLSVSLSFSVASSQSLGAMSVIMHLGFLLLLGN